MALISPMWNQVWRTARISCVPRFSDACGPKPRFEESSSIGDVRHPLLRERLGLREHRPHLVETRVAWGRRQARRRRARRTSNRSRVIRAYANSQPVETWPIVHVIEFIQRAVRLSSGGPMASSLVRSFSSPRSNSEIGEARELGWVGDHPLGPRASRHSRYSVMLPRNAISGWPRSLADRVDLSAVEPGVKRLPA